MSRRSDYLDYIVDGGVIDNLPLPVAPEDNGLYKMAVGGFGMEKAQGFYRCIAQGRSATSNLIGSYIDLGNETATSAKIKAVVTVKEDATNSAILPTAIGVRLFANNEEGRETVQGSYQSVDVPGTAPTNGGKQTIEAVLDNSRRHTSSTGDLAQNRYLKPFIYLNKGNVKDKHLIEIHEFTVEVNETVYDVTDALFMFMEDTECDFRYIKAEIPTYSISRRKMPFFNNKVVALGDSITFGFNSSNQGKQMANPWVSQLREKCGFLNAKNYGISSSTVSTLNTPGVPRNPMVDRVSQLDANADVVLFMGGVNDHTQNVKIGDIISTNKDKNTYFGAVNETLAQLSKTYADKIVVAMSPLDYVDANIAEGKNTNGNTVEDFRNAMKSACEMNKVLYFDLNSAVGFNANNPDDVKLYFTDADKLHPNQAGHNKMADAISKYLLSLV